MLHRPEDLVRTDEELKVLTDPLPKDVALVPQSKPGEHVGANFFDPLRPRSRKETPKFWDLIARRNPS